uniref:DDE Tnp4 domain-containing protein n=1 Tax=Amblyomma maculatum TaxID=34609 RepID=G3MTI8_AMBMU
MITMQQVALHQRRIQQLHLLEAIDAAEEERQYAEARCRRIMAITARLCSSERRLWAYPRGQSWYETTVPHLPDSEFRAHFRVTRSIFRYILNLCECMQRQDTAMRRAVPLDKRVAVSLYRLASSAEERTIANAFGLGRSTVNTIFREFCAVVVRQLGTKLVRLPKRSELAEHLRQFTAVTGFPQGVGALDGCHIEVCPPEEHASDYINNKGWYSTILLAIADHKYRFLYTNVGSPGRNHDAGVFESSSLPGILASHLFRAEGKVVAGVTVEPLLLADQAFPLQNHIMKPFPNPGPPGSPTGVFNYHLCRARRIVENAFGRLKARFRILLK